MKKNWIKSALDSATKGALHKQLGIAQNEKIPLKTLNKAASSGSPLLRKRANLAKTLRGLN